MRTSIIVITSMLALSGCISAPDHYDRPRTSHEQFQQDFAGCRLAAMGVPDQHTQVNSYTAQTSYYAPNQATTTIAPNPYAAAGAAIGDALANNHRQAKAIRLCMQSRGYSLRDQ